METKNDTKYIGVHKRKDNGKIIFNVKFQHDNVVYTFGTYKEPKDAAKAYDLFVLRKNINRKTNFFNKN